jgi:hypothetical protein
MSNENPKLSGGAERPQLAQRLGGVRVALLDGRQDAGNLGDEKNDNGPKTPMRQDNASLTEARAHAGMGASVAWTEVLKHALELLPGISCILAAANRTVDTGSQ